MMPGGFGRCPNCEKVVPTNAGGNLSGHAVLAAGRLGPDSREIRCQGSGGIPRPDPKLTLARAIEIARLALQFARVERITKHEDGVRPETDADHTIMLGLIAADLAPAWLDRGLVVQYALVHDFVEVHAGDTPTLKISTAERAGKEEREAAARTQLEGELGAHTWICRTLAAYEEQRDPESRFVRLLDKVMPKLTHALNDCAAAKVVVDYDGFLTAHGRQYEELATKYPEFPEILALLKASMEHAEFCWRCAVCGESIQVHVDGKMPGKVFLDGKGEVPCSEYPKPKPVEDVCGFCGKSKADCTWDHAEWRSS